MILVLNFVVDTHKDNTPLKIPEANITKEKKSLKRVTWVTRVTVKGWGKTVTSQNPFVGEAS